MDLLATRGQKNNRGLVAAWRTIGERAEVVCPFLLVYLAFKNNSECNFKGEQVSTKKAARSHEGIKTGGRSSVAKVSPKVVPFGVLAMFVSPVGHAQDCRAKKKKNMCTTPCAHMLDVVENICSFTSDTTDLAPFGVEQGFFLLVLHLHRRQLFLCGQKIDFLFILCSPVFYTNGNAFLRQCCLVGLFFFLLNIMILSSLQALLFK